MASKTAKKETAEVIEVNQERLEFCILGHTPLICNAMSAKIAGQLLLPPQKKNAAEKAGSPKHDPLAEYRRSVYTARDPDAPARIVMKATAFKKAMAGAALDLPGSTKTQIGRLVYVEGDEVPIFGVPSILLAVTRSADINKTPDVRSRAILPFWACRLSVSYLAPIIKQPAIVNLLAVAGITNGIGDWRVQKGSGNYGQFRLVSDDDPLFQKILAEGGRDAQDAALENPTSYDGETDELLSWYNAEVKRRGFKTVA